MKIFTSKLMAAFLLMAGWSFNGMSQTCPENADYSLAENQILEIEVQGGDADIDPSLGNYDYHLFEYNKNGYVYNPLDLGGDEHEEITMEFVPPNTLRFFNVPEGNYTLVLTGGDCSGNGKNFTELTPDSDPYFSFNPE